MLLMPWQWVERLMGREQALSPKSGNVVDNLRAADLTDADVSGSLRVADLIDADVLDSLRAADLFHDGASASDPDPTAIKEQQGPSGLTNVLPTQEDFFWGTTASDCEEDFVWRQLSDTLYQKDLIPPSYLEIHRLVYEAWQSNPLAHAIIEMTTNSVLGKGIMVAARNKRVQATLMRFWDDPDNLMDERIYQMCQELALYGELFVRFFVNPYDGAVKLRLIDPSLIDEIETDPDDVETELRFHRRPVQQTGSTLDAALLDTNHTQSNPPIDNFGSGHKVKQAALGETQGQWFLAGKEVMHFAINKVSNAKRGNSDLSPILPWLRRYRDWLLERVRINKYKSAFLWDVQLMGATKKDLDRKRMEYLELTPGSVILHNEGEKWSAVQPDIQADDAKEDGRAIKLMVAVGALIPEHFLSDGTTTNRATAAEMGLPMLLKFQRRQKVMRSLLRRILDRVIVEAQHAGKIGRSVDTSYDIIFPDIDTDDNQALAQGVDALTKGLALAKQQGWVSDETAMKLLFRFAAQEIDIPEEMERVRLQGLDGQ